MNETCIICGTANAEKAPTWLQVTVQPPGLMSPMVTVSALLFCPTCAGKTTVDKLPGLRAVKPPYAKPGN